MGRGVNTGALSPVGGIGEMDQKDAMCLQQPLLDLDLGMDTLGL